MSKVFLYKLPHVDVKRMTADAPLSVQLDDEGKGFLVSEKSGLKTTFTVTDDELADVAMVLNCSENVKNIAMHLMSYHGHDMERVINFISDTALYAPTPSKMTLNYMKVKKKLENHNAE